MAGLYPDANENPQRFLDRLRSKYNRDKLRETDRPIYDAGVQWANEQLAKTQSSTTTMTAPKTIPDAIAYFESIVHQIQLEDSAYETDSYVRGDDAILDEFNEYISSADNASGIELVELEMLSDGGGKLRAVVAKTPEYISALARHISKFCGLRRCSVVVKINGNEIRTDAPDADECERLLRVVDQLLIVKRGPEGDAETAAENDT